MLIFCTSIQVQMCPLNEKVHSLEIDSDFDNKFLCENVII